MIKLNKAIEIVALKEQLKEATDLIEVLRLQVRKEQELISMLNQEIRNRDITINLYRMREQRR